jgi:hypothetical protein
LGYPLFGRVFSVGESSGPEEFAVGELLPFRLALPVSESSPIGESSRDFPVSETCDRPGIASFQVEGSRYRMPPFQEGSMKGLFPLRVFRAFGELLPVKPVGSKGMSTLHRPSSGAATRPAFGFKGNCFRSSP